MRGASRLFFLTLLTFAGGCQTAKVSERQQPATDNLAPAKAKTSNRSKAQSQPVTPQSIVMELFPNAPEKSQTAECFRSLTHKMSMYAVVQECGRPDEEIGSGLYVFVYPLHDGSTVGISTPSLTRIDYATYTDKSGKSSSLLRRK